jgi:predicted phosphodiesterase
MKLTRVGLLGDIHAEDAKLEAALRFMQGAGMHGAAVERIVCVGDVVDGPGDAQRCCALLQEAGVVTVRGNHDRWLLTLQMRDLPDVTPLEQLSEQSRAFLAGLPATATLETCSGKMLVCHGVGENDMQQLKPDDCGYALEVNKDLRDLMRRGDIRYAVGGHTHRRMVRHFPPLTFINPGTLYRKYQTCIAIADFESLTVSFHDIVEDTVEVVGQTVPLAWDQ